MLIKISVQSYYYAFMLSVCIRCSLCNNFVERYSHSGITYYQRLMFDVHNYQLIVGARDYLLRLRLDNFDESRPEAYYLPSDSEKQKLCERKGMKKWQCRNYITVLLPMVSSKEVLICGTNAFSPECEIRQLSSLSTVIRRESAISRSAFSPLWNTSSLLTQSGDYYYAGPLDFRGIDAAIIRHSSSSLSSSLRRTSTTNSGRIVGSSSRKPILRTLQSDSKWINADANFVSSFEYENHVYFLFRESAVEYINCGKSIYSRIGRVCKNDNGGQLYYKENWTSFIKSRLNCSIPGLFPFYFDQLESVDWLESSDVPTIYATFNTPENSIHGSAVCAFRIDSILSSFHGQFKHQKNINSVWESANANKDIFECVASPRNGSELHEMERLNSQFQLMDSAVQAVNGRPYIVETKRRFGFIAVDVIQSKFHNSVEVIFVTTVDGLLLKYVRWPFSTQACLVDQIEVIKNKSDDSILSMKLLKDTQSLYLGTKREIVRVSLERCDNFVTRNQCLQSGDPYCGWNEVKMSCSTAPGRNPHSNDWIQSNSTSCDKSAVNEWSDWFNCKQLNDSLGDRCLCRMRSCSHSPDSSGLDGCSGGNEVQVTNCTLNGMWSEWSGWSSCSASCGSAKKTRYRKCSSPAPAFGGRNCRGPEREVIQCMNSPPCINLTLGSEEKTAIKPYNSWSEWSEWEQCSAKCGGGVQLRRRRCELDQKDRIGQNQNCLGCDVEWRLCNRHECQEIRQQSEWTDWLVKNITLDGLVEQRVRFTCRALLGDTYSVNIESRVEERFITSDTSWSECCSDSCNGWQFKWNGDYYLRRGCLSNQCTGWSEWSEWTQCVKGEQRRSRECDATNRCNGHYKELRYCRLNEQWSTSYESGVINSVEDKTAYKSSTSSKSGDANDHNNNNYYSLEKLLVCCLISFILGAIISGLLIYLYVAKNDRIRDMRHQRLSLKLFSSLKPSSNAYESPEQYKSNHSTLSPLNSISPVREATIKRSSTIRAKLHSDQNF